MCQIESENECLKRCQIECQKECQKICQNARKNVRIEDRMPERSQIGCQSVCQKKYQKICQVECQKICQTECRKECQKICQKICQTDMPERMSEDMPDRTASSRFQWATTSLDFTRNVLSPLPCQKDMPERCASPERMSAYMSEPWKTGMTVFLWRRGLNLTTPKTKQSKMRSWVLSWRPHNVVPLPFAIFPLHLSKVISVP